MLFLDVPVTELIIDAVEQLAERGGIKSMKFSTADGLPFEDPAWIAGVDDDDDESENSETYSDDDDSSDSDTDSDDDSNIYI